VDRVGPAPVFGVTALGMAALTAALTLVDQPDPGTLGAMIGFFFLHAVLTAGFGVADTHVLFALAPPEAPTRTLVIAAVVVNTAASLAPLATGIALDHLLSAADSGLVVYHRFFALAAIIQAASFLPLRSFRR
jgi:hypothetical protein